MRVSKPIPMPISRPILRPIQGPLPLLIATPIPVPIIGSLLLTHRLRRRGAAPAAPLVIWYERRWPSLQYVVVATTGGSSIPPILSFASGRIALLSNCATACVAGCARLRQLRCMPSRASLYRVPRVVARVMRAPDVDLAPACSRAPAARPVRHLGASRISAHGLAGWLKGIGQASGPPERRACA